MNRSQTKYSPIPSVTGATLLLCLGTLAVPTPAPAQGQPQSAQAQHAQANPLPLYGRGGGNGSVTAVESPIAGTTNSVVTINPTVQVEGPYAGSSSGAANLPSPGKLSLRDAIERGLKYNLGALGQSHAVRLAQGQSQVARSALLPKIGRAH